MGPQRPHMCGLESLGLSRIELQEWMGICISLGRYNMILNLPEPYWGECSCEVAILSCFCALIGAKESPNM